MTYKKIWLGFIIGLVILSLIFKLNTDEHKNENCIYDNKKILDMGFSIEEGHLIIKFEDCSDCEHYWICFDDVEYWYFEKEFDYPKHIKIGDYVRMKKCLINGTYYSRNIEKIG